MNAEWFPEEKKAIDEIMTIGRPFDVTVFFEIYFDAIIGAFVGEDDHIWEYVHIIWIIDINGLVFLDKVPGFSLNYISKTGIQHH